MKDRVDPHDSSNVDICLDDLRGPDIARFLEEHIADMRSISPPESKHALDIEGLRKSEITFWSVYRNGRLIGCGALKQLASDHGEIKSMRVASSERGKGIAAQLLSHIITVSRKRGYKQLSLETGSMPFLKPARALYRRFHFVECDPFANYRADSNSVFMNLTLDKTT